MYLDNFVAVISQSFRLFLFLVYYKPKLKTKVASSVKNYFFKVYIENIDNTRSNI